MTADIELCCIELASAYVGNADAEAAFQSWSSLDTGDGIVTLTSSTQATSDFAFTAKQVKSEAVRTVIAGEVDDTLTTSGAAADAAATGAKFTEQNTTVSALQRDLTDVRADIRRTPESIYCLHDADGNVVAYIDDNSVAHFYKITARNFGEATKNVENIEVDGTEVAMFPCYGQSWSVGYQTGAAISTVQNWDSLMFSGGAIPQESEAADPTGSFVPLVEQSYSTENAETPCSGQCNIIKELLDTENGLDLQNFGNYRLLSSAPGLGGAQISQLAKGTEPYDRLLSQVRQAKSICDSLGKNFSVPAISWIQGSTVAQEISQLQTDLNADIKAITGQKQDVKLITWEYYSSGSYTGYLLENSYVKDVHEMNSNVVCACPSYMLRYMGEGSATEAPTNIHFTAESSKWIGGYMGIAYKRLVLEKQDWQPLRPIAYTVDGNRIYIKFHVPVPPLRFNTTLVAKAENYGFEVTDYNGNFNEITDVSIVGTDTVKLTLSSSYNNAYNVTYADQRKAGYEGLGALYGRRGNLCDSQDIIFSELEKEMPNFCVVFGRSGLEG
jgi:hypothetical protein